MNYLIKTIERIILTISAVFLFDDLQEILSLKCITSNLKNINVSKVFPKYFFKEKYLIFQL